MRNNQESRGEVYGVRHFEMGVVRRCVLLICKSGNSYLKNAQFRRLRTARR